MVPFQGVRKGPAAVFPHCGIFPVFLSLNSWLRHTGNRADRETHVALQAQAPKPRNGKRAAPAVRPVRPGSDHVQSLGRALALLNRISEAADGRATLTE